MTIDAFEVAKNIERYYTLKGSLLKGSPHSIFKIHSEYIIYLFLDLGCARNAALTQTHSTVTKSKCCDGWLWDHINKRFFNDTGFEHFRKLLISRDHQ